MAGSPLALAEESLVGGDAYTAQQLIKTACGRHSNRGRHAQARELAAQGVDLMASRNHFDNASELAGLFAQSCLDEGTQETPQLMEWVLATLARFPEDAPLVQVRFAEVALRWTAKCGAHKQGHPAIHDALAVRHHRIKSFGEAARHYTNGASTEGYAGLLREWAQHVLGSERDLLLARAVLTVAAKPEGLDRANALFLALSRDAANFPPSPLLRFVQLLLEALQRKDAALFELLRKAYAPSLKRDTGFQSVLDQMGLAHFGLRPAVTSPLQGMLQNLMRAQ